MEFKRGIEDSNLIPSWNLGHGVNLEGLPMMSWGEVKRRDLVRALEMVRSIMKQLKPVLIWGTTVKFAILTLCGWIENPNYFSFLISYMMNQFINPFRKISPNKILQKILKINWSKKSYHFFQLHVAARPYTTERNENSKRVHSAVNRCADRSGNISAASNTPIFGQFVTKVRR